MKFKKNMTEKAGKMELVDVEYIKWLKHHNKALAKALTDLKDQYADERIVYQKKLYTATILNNRYNRLFNEVMEQAKLTLPTCVALSDSIAGMIKLCNEGINLHKSLEINEKEVNNSSFDVPRSVSPGSQHKTHVVNPMVSGHVIFRPTINLWRLSESAFREETEVAELASESVQSNSCSAPTLRRISVAELASETVQNNSRYTPALGQILEENEEESNLVDSVTVLPNASLRFEATVEPLNVSGQESRKNYMREARIVINPLPSAVINASTQSSSCTKNEVLNNSCPSKKPKYDPLEGPSTLLDDQGFCRQQRYVTKQRQVKYRHSSDSDSSDNSDDGSFDKKRSKVKRKNTAKYKLNSENISLKNKCMKAKKTRIKSSTGNVVDGTSNNQPVVILTQIPASTVMEYNHQDEIVSKGSFVSEPKSRRIKSNISFKEPSLKCKLRRNT